MPNEPSHSQIYKAVLDLTDGQVALSSDIANLDAKVTKGFKDQERRIDDLENHDRISSVETEDIKKRVDSVRAKSIFVSVAKVVLPKGFGEISLTGFSGITVVVVMSMFVIAATSAVVIWLAR